MFLICVHPDIPYCVYSGYSFSPKSTETPLYVFNIFTRENQTHDLFSDELNFGMFFKMGLFGR